MFWGSFMLQFLHSSDIFVTEECPAIWSFHSLFTPSSVGVRLGCFYGDKLWKCYTHADFCVEAYRPRKTQSVGQVTAPPRLYNLTFQPQCVRVPVFPHPVTTCCCLYALALWDGNSLRPQWAFTLLQCALCLSAIKSLEVKTYSRILPNFSLDYLSLWLSYKNFSYILNTDLWTYRSWAFYLHHSAYNLKGNSPKSSVRTRIFASFSPSPRFRAHAVNNAFIKVKLRRSLSNTGASVLLASSI